MSNLPCLSLFQIFSARVFELVYSWKSYHKNKKGELFLLRHSVESDLSDTGSILSFEYTTLINPINQSVLRSFYFELFILIN